MPAWIKAVVAWLTREAPPAAAAAEAAVVPAALRVPWYVWGCLLCLVAGCTCGGCGGCYVEKHRPHWFGESAEPPLADATDMVGIPAYPVPPAADPPPPAELPVPPPPDPGDLPAEPVPPDPAPPAGDAGADLLARAVREGRRLVAFVGMDGRPLPGCIAYHVAAAEPGEAARYVALAVPDGRGSYHRYTLPECSPDWLILGAGERRPPGSGRRPVRLRDWVFYADD